MSLARNLLVAALFSAGVYAAPNPKGLLLSVKLEMNPALFDTTKDATKTAFEQIISTIQTELASEATTINKVLTATVGTVTDVNLSTKVYEVSKTPKITADFATSKGETGYLFNIALQVTGTDCDVYQIYQAAFEETTQRDAFAKQLYDKGVQGQIIPSGSTLTFPAMVGMQADGSSFDVTKAPADCSKLVLTPPGNTNNFLTLPVFIYPGGTNNDYSSSAAIEAFNALNAGFVKYFTEEAKVVGKTITPSIYTVDDLDTSKEVYRYNGSPPLNTDNLKVATGKKGFKFMTWIKFTGTDCDVWQVYDYLNNNNVARNAFSARLATDAINAGILPSGSTMSFGTIIGMRMTGAASQSNPGFDKAPSGCNKLGQGGGTTGTTVVDADPPLTEPKPVSSYISFSVDLDALLKNPKVANFTAYALQANLMKQFPANTKVLINSIKNSDTGDLIWSALGLGNSTKRALMGRKLAVGNARVDYTATLPVGAKTSFIAKLQSIPADFLKAIQDGVVAAMASSTDPSVNAFGLELSKITLAAAPPAAAGAASSSSSSSVALGVGIGVGVGGAILIAIIAYCMCCQKKSPKVIQSEAPAASA